MLLKTLLPFVIFAIAITGRPLPLKPENAPAPPRPGGPTNREYGTPLSSRSSQVFQSQYSHRRGLQQHSIKNSSSSTSFGVEPIDHYSIKVDLKPDSKRSYSIARAVSVATTERNPLVHGQQLPTPGHRNYIRRLPKVPAHDYSATEPSETDEPPSTPTSPVPAPQEKKKRCPILPGKRHELDVQITCGQDVEDTQGTDEDQGVDNEQEFGDNEDVEDDGNGNQCTDSNCSSDIPTFGAPQPCDPNSPNDCAFELHPNLLESSAGSFALPAAIVQEEEGVVNVPLNPSQLTGQLMHGFEELEAIGGTQADSVHPPLLSGSSELGRVSDMVAPLSSFASQFSQGVNSGLDISSVPVVGSEQQENDFTGNINQAIGTTAGDGTSNITGQDVGLPQHLNVITEAIDPDDAGSALTGLTGLPSIPGAATNSFGAVTSSDNFAGAGANVLDPAGTAGQSSSGPTQQERPHHHNDME